MCSTDQEIPATLAPRLPRVCKAVAESLCYGEIREFDRVGIHDHPDFYLESYRARPGVVVVRLICKDTVDVAAWYEFGF